MRTKRPPLNKMPLMCGFKRQQNLFLNTKQWIGSALLLGATLLMSACGIGSHVTGDTEALQDDYPDINTVPFDDAALLEKRSFYSDNAKAHDLKTLTQQNITLDAQGRTLWEDTFQQKRPLPQGDLF